MSHCSIERPIYVKKVIKVELNCKKLKSLPKWISECSSLKILYCNNNQITKIPSTLPASLKILYCNNNQITKILSTLPASLQILNCSENQITELPSTLSSSLQELYCGWNQITELPSTLPSSLQELYCSNNRIIEFSSPLPSSLQGLYCSNNQIRELPSILPASLRILYCRNNQITELPISLLQNRNLTYIDYRGNPIENFHPLIVRFLNRQRTNLKSISVYTDRQSVHNHSIQKSIKKSIFNVLSDKPKKTKDVVIKEIVEDSILSPSSKEALLEYSKDQTEHSSIGITFFDLLIPVWERICDKAFANRVLDVEIQDSICKCFTGRISRLVNCLNGFFPDVSVKIGDSDQIGNVIILVKKKLEEEKKYSTDLHKEIVVKELIERGFGKEVIDEWIEYI